MAFSRIKQSEVKSARPIRAVALTPASLKQNTFDELWNNRSDLDLHVPLLPVNPGMHRNVLHREGKFDGQTPEFHHLAQADSNGDCPDVRRRRVPVHQDITRVE